jgi:hypothetical protein
MGIRYLVVLKQFPNIGIFSVHCHLVDLIFWYLNVVRRIVPFLSNIPGFRAVVCWICLGCVVWLQTQRRNWFQAISCMQRETTVAYSSVTIRDVRETRGCQCMHFCILPLSGRYIDATVVLRWMQLVAWNEFHRCALRVHVSPQYLSNWPCATPLQTGPFGTTKHTWTRLAAQ